MPLTRIESLGYWICFVAAFFAIAVAESWRERRPLATAAERRWKNHAALFAIGALISGVLLRATPVVLALLVANNPYGALNKSWLPYWLRCLIAILALDLVQYARHWANHHVAWLWRVHQVHHSDFDYDVSTSVRFHPIEMLLGAAAQLAAIALLAPPALGVLIHELLVVIVNLLAARECAAAAPGRPTAPLDWWRRPTSTACITRSKWASSRKTTARFSFGGTACSGLSGKKPAADEKKLPDGLSRNTGMPTH